MSETDDSTHDDQTDVSELSDQGIGATMSDEPNTMEPEEALPEEDD